MLAWQATQFGVYSSGFRQLRKSAVWDAAGAAAGAAARGSHLGEVVEGGEVIPEHGLRLGAAVLLQLAVLGGHLRTGTRALAGATALAAHLAPQLQPHLR